MTLVKVHNFLPSANAEQAQRQVVRRDLIGERALQLQARREQQAKDYRPYLPNTAAPTTLADTPCRGLNDPIFRRTLHLMGKRTFVGTEEQFGQALRQANAMVDSVAKRRGG